ncbi:MAG: hypothetical protein HKM06_00510 [Spirochaetales bacterium]|nr:hypothetical protein [Spirochaetales bacterium]
MHENYRVVLVIRGDQAFFRVPWTPLRLADRHDIALQVPSVAGLFQIFWEDGRKRLHPFASDTAWYGGVRTKLAEAIDVDHEHDPARKKILEEHRLFYRYAVCESWNDLQDLGCLYTMIEQPQKTPPASSGRFKTLHLSENPVVLGFQ